MTEIQFIGFDLEATGLDPEGGNVPIQVGLATRVAGQLEVVQMPIYHEPGTFTWHPKAFEVNGLTLDMISGPDAMGWPPELVDEAIVRQVMSWCAGPQAEIGQVEPEPRRPIALGLNVGSFDFRFVRAHLPLTYDLFGHQYADLNSMRFLLESRGLDWPPADRQRYIAEHLELLGVEGDWHCAGYDAAASVIQFEAYREKIAFRSDRLISATQKLDGTMETAP